jgi:hypothetical protein
MNRDKGYGEKKGGKKKPVPREETPSSDYEDLGSKDAAEEQGIQKTRSEIVHTEPGKHAMSKYDLQYMKSLEEEL